MRTVRMQTAPSTDWTRERLRGSATSRPAPANRLAKPMLALLGAAALAFPFAPTASGRGATYARGRQQCRNSHLSPNRQNLAAVTRATLCLINRARVLHGLAPLAADRHLAVAARLRTREMLSAGFLTDGSLAGGTVSERLAASGYFAGHRSGSREVGENVAAGTGSQATPASIVHAWMLSAPHRQNILDGGFRATGIGVFAAAPRNSFAGFGCPCATYTEELGSLY